MTVVDIARKYLGETEKPGNSGFDDAEFEKKMKAVGFEKGHAWCSYFAELCFKEAYPDRFKELDKLFSASAVQTFRNFRDAAHLINEVPVEGNLVIWQNYAEGKPIWSGHVGIVSKVLANGFMSIEGNTNAAGGREGFEVAEKIREIKKNRKDGLNIIGFIKV